MSDVPNGPAILSGFSEDQWEHLAMDTLAELGWKPVAGKDIAPGTGERQSWDELVIPGRVLEAMQPLNPTVPAQYLKQALAEILAPTSQDAITENHRIHDILTKGYRGVSYVDADGQEQTPTIRLVSVHPDANEWLVVNQVTLVQGDLRRRYDVVLYCNGMPVSIFELKRAGSESADVAAAYAQLQTYLREFPMSFRFAVCTLASDGIAAEYGTPFTQLNHFSPWNVDDDGRPVKPGERVDSGADTALELALFGLFNQERFLQLLRSFTAFDEGSGGLEKRIAKPHQYFAVTKAVGSTVAAVESNGKAGVVWHSQGSGKSMEMELYTNQVLTHPKLLNPTVVVVTDRKELDGQLYETFDKSLLLPEKPMQVARRSVLREELSSRSTGGIYFTTLQKFGLSKDEREAGMAHPVLSDRRNVIVIVDEAHRSHYDDLDGYAWHLKNALPHATLIAFTGTPISFEDRNTREVFGDYVDIYDLSRAVEDKATVPVHFEPRLIKVALADEVTEETLDEAADEVTAGLDEVERARIERSVAVVNAVYGAPARIEALADDIVSHWENRRAAMRPFIEANGKAMIVCGTREICANLYAEIVKLRPDWHSDELDRGVIKVVYSGTPSDTSPVVEHVRRESENKVIKQRLRDVDDELEIVIVKDMMLTGYDSPPLHTLYLDRPLKGALLMQTLARVNRTFRGKQDGLLVSYAPLAENLQQALAEYTTRDRAERPVGRNIDEAAALTESLVTMLRGLVSGHDWKAEIASHPTKGYIKAVNSTVAYIRDPSTPGNQAEEESERLAARYRRLSGQLARAWAVASGAESLQELHPEIRFYEEVRVWMAKYDAMDRRARGEPVPEEVSRLLSELVAESTITGGVVDIYEAAGMPTPSLDDLTPAFFTRVEQAEHPHLAIEALRSLLTEESARATRGNVIRERAFSDRITELMNKYINSQLTSAEVIAELIALAKEVAEEKDRGKRFEPPLNDDELAFYDAVAQNESAVLEQGDDVLARIARDLVAVMRRDVRTDWTVRDDVRAKLRSSIKRLLIQHGYPPDKQPAAIKLVMEQMEALAPRYALELSSKMV
jgi:type I restriction enzyme R subunit